VHEEATITVQAIWRGAPHPLADLLLTGINASGPRKYVVLLVSFEIRITVQPLLLRRNQLHG
jgi:hypothetical protein